VIVAVAVFVAVLVGPLGVLVMVLVGVSVKLLVDVLLGVLVFPPGVLVMVLVGVLLGVLVLPLGVLVIVLVLVLVAVLMAPVVLVGVLVKAAVVGVLVAVTKLGESGDVKVRVQLMVIPRTNNNAAIPSFKKVSRFIFNSSFFQSLSEIGRMNSDSIPMGDSERTTTHLIVRLIISYEFFFSLMDGIFITRGESSLAKCLEKILEGCF